MRWGQSPNLARDVRDFTRLPCGLRAAFRLLLEDSDSILTLRYLLFRYSTPLRVPWTLGHDLVNGRWTKAAVTAVSCGGVLDVDASALLAQGPVTVCHIATSPMVTCSRPSCSDQSDTRSTTPVLTSFADHRCPTTLSVTLRQDVPQQLRRHRRPPG